RAALATITSLDPDQWGSAWMAIGDRYVESAGAAERRGDIKTMQQDLLAAWRLYTFGRWPVARSPKKIESYAKARAAFEAYGRRVDPPIETVRIPFEGKEIVGFLQIPRRVARPPVLVSIGGSDLWKDTV